MSTDDFSEFLNSPVPSDVEYFDEVSSSYEYATQSSVRQPAAETDSDDFAQSRTALQLSPHTPKCNLPQTQRGPAAETDSDDFAHSRTPKHNMPPRSSVSSDHLGGGSTGLVAIPSDDSMLNVDFSVFDGLSDELNFTNDNYERDQQNHFNNALGISMDELNTLEPGPPLVNDGSTQVFYQNDFSGYVQRPDASLHPALQQPYMDGRFNGMPTGVPTHPQAGDPAFANFFIPETGSATNHDMHLQPVDQELPPNWYSEDIDQFGVPLMPGHNATFHGLQTDVYPEPEECSQTYFYPDPMEAAATHSYYHNGRPVALAPSVVHDATAYEGGNGRANAVQRPNRKYSATSDVEQDLPSRRRRQQRSASSHDYSSSVEPPQSDPIKQTVFRAGEKPKKSANKSWVRCNNATRGETTRTARINHYKPKYNEHSLPHGDWQSAHFDFEYAQDHGLHFFKSPDMSGRQVHEYITQHPDDNLRIWIQVTPADSNRRYGSATHAQCIFKDCPNKKWIKKGTISVGHYRVAFDEKSKFHVNSSVDPFDCVGFAHLYCMERFVDFPAICRATNVKVDGRLNMRKESKGESPVAFARRHLHEKGVAEKFVMACQDGALHRTSQFQHYPPHNDWHGLPKQYEHTLNAVMQRTYIQSQTPSLQKQTVMRDPNPGSQYIHHGDLEVSLCDKKIEDLPAFWKAKKRSKEAPKAFDKSAYYDSFHPEINLRIADFLELRAQFQAGRVAPSQRKRRAPKPVVEEVEEDSEEEHSDHDSEEESDEEERRRVTSKTKHRHSTPRPPKRKFGEFAGDSEDEISDGYPDGEADPYERKRPTKKNQVLRVSKRQKTRVNYADEPVDVEELEDSSLETVTMGGRMYMQVPKQKFVLGNIQRQQQQRIEVLQNEARLQSPQVSPKTLVGDCNELIETSSPPADLLKTPKLEDDMAFGSELAHLLGEQLNRRKSSVGPIWGILKSVDSQLEGKRLTRGVLKAATFKACPVSSSQEFDVHDPPEAVRDAAAATHNGRVRRSSRLASKSV